MSEPFYYAITSLRVDGDQSADPDDYLHWPSSKPVGEVLVAYLRAHLAAPLTPKGLRYQVLPGRPARGLSWDMDEGYVVVVRPKVRDLRRWSRALALRLGCSGNVEVLFDPEPAIDLDALVAAVKARRQTRT